MMCRGACVDPKDGPNARVELQPEEGAWNEGGNNQHCVDCVAAWACWPVLDGGVLAGMRGEVRQSLGVPTWVMLEAKPMAGQSMWKAGWQQQRLPGHGWGVAAEVSVSASVSLGRGKGNPRVTAAWVNGEDHVLVQFMEGWHGHGEDRSFQTVMPVPNSGGHRT